MDTIFSANVNIIDFVIIDFVGKDDWGLDEPAPYFDLAVGFYLEAGIHYAENDIAGYVIEYKVHGWFVKLVFH